MLPFPIRGLLVAAALLVVAWLLLGYRAVALQEEAEATLHRAQGGSVTIGDQRRAEHLLHRAKPLNPDPAPLLDEGFLMSAVGRRNQAFAIAFKAIAKEPENVQAWTLLYLASPTREQRLAAKRRVARLNPWLADQLQ